MKPGVFACNVKVFAAAAYEPHCFFLVFEYYNVKLLCELDAYAQIHVM